MINNLVGHWLFVVSNICIQLFWQRLSQERVKVYATMSIGIMGSKSLVLLNWGSSWLSNKKRERTNTCLCCFLPPCWNTLRLNHTTVKTIITHNNFRHCRVRFTLFIRQPFSKQLYVHVKCWMLHFAFYGFCWQIHVSQELVMEINYTLWQVEFWSLKARLTHSSQYFVATKNFLSSLFLTVNIGKVIMKWSCAEIYFLCCFHVPRQWNGFN